MHGLENVKARSSRVNLTHGQGDEQHEEQHLGEKTD
jgi:hypothetical protein